MILTAIVFLPLLGASLAALLPREEAGQLRWAGLLTMLAVFGLSLWAWLAFDASPSAPEFQLDFQVPWVPAVGFSYHVGVDGLALVLVLLTAFLTPLALLSAFAAIKDRVKEFVVALLLLETAMLGTLVALDLVLFYVFWEAMLLPMYLLIGVWGYERRVYAAVKLFVYTMSGSLLMLIALLYVYFASGGPGARSFDLPQILAQLPHLSLGAQRLAFVAFALAFAIKVPMFPLHTWLPDAHVEAPAAGSILLAGVLLKMGAFGFLRFAFPLFPDAAAEFRGWLALLAVIGIVYGALMSMAQSDMKKLVAYSSVSHMGFVMLGICALSVEGVSGGIYQMLNHGISTGALFALVGLIYERRHTRELSQYGGLARVVPVLAVVFLIVTLSSIGLPGTNGFVGEFLCLAGTFSSHLSNGPWYAAGGGVGVILGAVYMLAMYQRVFFGPLKHPENARLPDLSGRELAVLLPLCALILGMGFFPGPILARIEPAGQRLVDRLERGRRDTFGTPPAALVALRPPLPPRLPAQPGAGPGGPGAPANSFGGGPPFGGAPPPAGLGPQFHPVFPGAGLHPTPMAVPPPGASGPQPQTRPPTAPIPATKPAPTTVP